MRTAFRKRSRYSLAIVHSVFKPYFVNDAVDPLVVAMELVKAEFIAYDIKQDETGGDAYCEASDVDKRIYFFSRKAAVGR